MPRKKTLPSPQTPAPTPEFAALTPQVGEDAMEALARVGESIVQDAKGSDTKDARPNKKMPRQLAALVALRAQGFDNYEIAERLGLTRLATDGRAVPDYRKLNALVARARREYGWSDLDQKLADVAVPLAVESAIRHLEHEGSALGIMEGMSTMTRATLTGVGLFKNHSAVKQETENRNTNVLRVEIVLPQLPPGDSRLGISDGSVLATPRRALVHPGLATPAAPIVEGEVVAP